jgi:hypothetical protein
MEILDMTSKDFIITAACLCNCLETSRNRVDADNVRHCIEELADTYAKSFPSFDRAKFIQACGLLPAA